MSFPSTIDTVGLLIKIGNAADPEVFAHPCLINASRSFGLSAETKANQVADCTDPTLPMKTVRTTVALDSEISGEGQLDTASAKTYLDKVGDTMNIKVSAGTAAGSPIITGAYILESFVLTGPSKGDLVTCALKFVQADAPAITAAT